MEDDKFNKWFSPSVQLNTEFPPNMNMLNEEIPGAFGNARNVGDDPAFFPPNQSFTAPLPWRQMHGVFQTYPYALSDASNSVPVDFNQPPNFQDPLREPNFTNIAGDVPIFNQPCYPLPQGENRAESGYNLMNVSPPLGSFQNYGLGRNSSLSGDNVCEFIDLTSEDGCSDFGGTQGMRGNSFHGPGIENTVSNHPQHMGGIGCFNQNQMNLPRFGNLRREDGSFLSLGNEDKTNLVPKSDFGNRGIGHLGSSVSPSLNISHFQGPGSSMNPAPNFTVPRFGYTPGGLPSSQHNMGGFASSQNCTGGLPCFQNRMGEFSSSQNNLGGLSNSQNSMGGFPSARNNVGGWNSSITNVGAVSNASYLPNTKASHDVQRPQAIRGNYIPKPSKSDLGSMPNPDTRYVNMNPIDILRDRLKINSGPFGNSPTGLSHSTQMGVSNAASSSVGFSRPTAQPNSERVQQFFHDTLRSNWDRTDSSGREMESSFSRGYGGPVPALNNSSAQAGNETTQLPMRRIRTNSNLENYGQLQASDHHATRPIKRSIIHPNPNLARVQRRRTIPQHPSSPYGSSCPQAAQAGPDHIRAPRGGSGRVPKPSGYKCMLCKRDLAFAPEGPIQQPSILPGVAVLSCQHTFHDHCLQLITPEGQAKDPPCIPCAMGEK